ncbi:DUF1128 domain-containing protein [Shouchella sp. 1P09AA]|uniref:DUF1128 domain-containing protein n=1 Tax=Bacillaceae TaxID=186817 RepID=UPI000C07FDC5|nr:MULTISPECIES: DUF1128 domain-containing protein [Bacillaceae]UTR04801.1 DUF1128 domain-containing protein [Alkalihalobacillus sp. LMS6]
MGQSLSSNEVETLVEEIKKKLNVVNASVIKANSVSPTKHDDLIALHTHVMRQPSFSISEMDEIVQELGQLRET